jgi:hypothetical protein
MPKVQRFTLTRHTEAPRHRANLGSVPRCLGVPWLRAACAILYVVAAIDVASATVLLPADFTTIVTGSPVIVHGRVTDVRSFISGPRRTIESVVTLSVIDTFKGAPARTVLFRVPNGQVGRYRRVVVGAPEFEEGDEVVVFLQAHAPAIPTLFGLSQGVYRVVHDANAQAMVTPPAVMARGVSAERVVRGDPVRQPMPIDAFAREVRRVLERAR